MANYAALIDTLSVSGSRLTDGTANASGTVYFFTPGTNTPVSVYADAAATTIVTQPVTLGAGGKLPTQYAAGIFAKVPVRIYISDVSGNVITDNVWIPATAGDVGVNNAGFTDSTLDNVLTKAFTSFGGQDWKYLVSTGQTPLNYKDVVTGIQVSVKAFGAVGNGIAIDTTAVQAAINFVKAAGGGVVYFPPGTYVVDQGLTVTSATGITLLGVLGATTIKLTHATANLYTLATASTQCVIDGLIFTHATSTSGVCVRGVGASQLVIRNTTLTSGAFNEGVFVSGSSDITIQNCTIRGTATGLDFGDTGTNFQSLIINSTLVGTSTAALSVTGSGANMVIVGGQLFGANGIFFTGAFTGGPVYVYGCRNFGTTPYGLGSLSVIPSFRRWGDGIDGYTADVTSGGTVTPDLSKGYNIRIRGTTTGVAYTVNAPTPRPSATADPGGAMRDFYLRLSLYNNAGGAITGWTMNAVYHLSSAPSTTDGQTTNYLLLWDPDRQIWADTGRTVTT